MGMYTSVILDDGTDVQFKTGWDDCDRFKVGDPVPWRVIPDNPPEGFLLDGVYDAVSGRYSPEARKEIYSGWWVVIKDHRIHEVVPRTADEVSYAQECHLFHRYALEHPDPKLWTEAAWASKALRDEEERRRRIAWEARTFGMTPDDRAGLAVREYTLTKMQETGILHRIFSGKE